jgi:hypothetical protein
VMFGTRSGYQQYTAVPAGIGKPGDAHVSYPVRTCTVPGSFRESRRALTRLRRSGWCVMRLR